MFVKNKKQKTYANKMKAQWQKPGEEQKKIGSI